MRRKEEIMRNYRTKIKCKKVSETDRRLKLDAQKSYMKESPVPIVHVTGGK